MQHSQTWDDRLLALQVERALKALGIAAGGDDRRDGDLRLAVEDLRGTALAPSRRAAWVSATSAPSLSADDDDIFGLR